MWVWGMSGCPVVRGMWGDWGAQQVAAAGQMFGVHGAGTEGMPECLWWAGRGAWVGRDLGGTRWGAGWCQGDEGVNEACRGGEGAKVCWMGAGGDEGGGQGESTKERRAAGCEEQKMLAGIQRDAGWVLEDVMGKTGCWVGAEREVGGGEGGVEGAEGVQDRRGAADPSYVQGYRRAGWVLGDAGTRRDAEGRRSSVGLQDRERAACRGTRGAGWVQEDAGGVQRVLGHGAARVQEHHRMHARMQRAMRKMTALEGMQGKGAEWNRAQGQGRMGARRVAWGALGGAGLRAGRCRTGGAAEAPGEWV